MIDENYNTKDYEQKTFTPAGVFDPELVLPNDAVKPRTKDNFPMKTWIEARGGAIKSWVFPETGEPAWKIIEDAANETGVSRKLLAVTLQREQSLIRAMVLDPKKLDRACGQAVFDPRPLDPPALRMRRAEITARNKGFKNQVFGAAKTYAKRYDEWKKGMEIKVNYSNGDDPMTVSDDSWDVRVPRNAGTWALLRYTPHDAASRVTRDIWRGFFGA